MRKRKLKLYKRIYHKALYPPISRKFIYVFASNVAGIHISNAATLALENYGAVQGIGVGISDRSYAIPVRDRGMKVLPLKDIVNSVKEFIEYAKTNDDLLFWVSDLCAGDEDITANEHAMAPYYLDAPFNCILPLRYKKYILKARSKEDFLRRFKSYNLTD